MPPWRRRVTAFDHGAWPRLHPRARGEILQHFADLVEEHRKEIALLISLEMGKPIRDAYQIELRALIRCLRFYGELADKESGEITPTEEGELSLVTREPAGVVAAVVPWNFPLTLGGWKLAPALAAGCTVVLKTAEQSPLSMQRVAELGVDGGFAAGCLQCAQRGRSRWSAATWENTPMSTCSPLPGRPRSGAISCAIRQTATSSGSISNSAASHPTSSSRTLPTWTRPPMRRPGRSTSTPVRCVPQAPGWWFTPMWPTGWWNGSWTPPPSGSRPIRCFRTPRWARWWMSAACSACSDISTVVWPKAPHCGSGGQRVLSETGGAYLEPTVVTGAAPDNPIVREEIFGPVLAVQVVSDEAEAVRVAGDTPYGLAAALWTSDLGTAHRVSRALRAGTVWVNCYEEGDMAVPFGGVKLSGFGRDKSRHALEEYTYLKTTWIRYA